MTIVEVNLHFMICQILIQIHFVWKIVHISLFKKSKYTTLFICDKILCILSKVVFVFRPPCRYAHLKLPPLIFQIISFLWIIAVLLNKRAANSIRNALLLIVSVISLLWKFESGRTVSCLQFFDIIVTASRR